MDCVGEAGMHGGVSRVRLGLSILSICFAEGQIRKEGWLFLNVSSFLKKDEGA